MKCLEMIMLRSARNLEKTVLRNLVTEIGAAAAADGIMGLKCYRNVNVGGDLSVLIQRDAAEGAAGKSALGLQLASLFSEFGLVNHSIWIEE